MKFLNAPEIYKDDIEQLWKEATLGKIPKEQSGIDWNLWGIVVAQMALQEKTINTLRAKLAKIESEKLISEEYECLENANSCEALIEEMAKISKPVDDFLRRCNHPNA